MPSRKKPSPLPTTFQEQQRHYTLDVAPEGRLGSQASSAEACLRTMTYMQDGTIYTIVARYKDQVIGEGRYRKRGPSGSVETVEPLETHGAMVGLIEAALAQREAARQAEQCKERAGRLIALCCPACNQVTGYDPVDQVFAHSTGEAITVCPSCGGQLSLELIQHHYEQRLQQLRADLLQIEAAMRQIRQLRTGDML